MKRVQLLSDEVIKKIAAGEVVERPASVVKELVENSIDAGAKHISIELEDGGIKRITIQDDGCGIPPEDCLLALRRHATSKITGDEDLFAISTLGFRGEALAAISSIADFSLISRVRGTEKGCKVTIEGGNPPELTDWSGAEGTTITVANLFCTVPVRAKFLKNSDTEFAQCHDLIQALSLSSPHIGFTLHHNQKLKFSAQPLPLHLTDTPWRGESILRQRWELIVGKEEAQNALYVREENAYGRWEALLSTPGHDKATHKHVIHFANGRWVKDKILNFGIQRGYHSHLLKGRHPQALSFYDCDPSLIDVNVHPAKTELRFQYPAEVQGLISFAIRKHMREAAWASHSVEEHKSLARDPSTTLGMTNGTLGMTGGDPSQQLGMTSKSQDLTNPFQASAMTRLQKPSSFMQNGSEEKGGPQTMQNEKPANTFSNPQAWSVGDSFSSSADILHKRENFSNISSSQSPKTQTQQTLFPKTNFQNLNYIGTYGKCYLLFEHETKLLAIDQHAFHERILYERLCSHSQLLSETQALMMPEAISLNSKTINTLKSHQNLIHSIGFSINILSDTLIEIISIPTLMVNKRFDDFFVNFAEKLDEGHTLSADQIHHDMLATLACHAAVRAGEELSQDELKILLKEAETVDFFHNCPHGRRVLKWFERSQVAGWFDR